MRRSSGRSSMYWRLTSRISAAMTRAWSGSVGRANWKRSTSTRCPRGTGRRRTWSRKIRASGSASNRARGTRSSWVITVKPDDLPGAVARRPERVGQAAPPVLEDRDRLRRLGRRRDRVDRRPVAVRRRIDEVEVLGRREERLADRRVLEDVEQVRRVAPHLVRGRARDLVAELPPGGDPVAPGPVGIRRPQVRGDDLADGVVDDQAVAAQLDERQDSQPVEGVLRRCVGQHRAHQRERRAAGPPRRRRAPGGSVDRGARDRAP